MMDKNNKGDFSTKVGNQNSGAVAGGVNTKATVNEKDNSAIIKTIVKAVVVLIGVIVLVKLGVINANNLPDVVKNLPIFK